MAGSVSHGTGAPLESMALFLAADFKYPYLEQSIKLSLTAPANRPGRLIRFFNAFGIMHVLLGLGPAMGERRERDYEQPNIARLLPTNALNVVERFIGDSPLDS